MICVGDAFTVALTCTEYSAVTAARPANGARSDTAIPKIALNVFRMMRLLWPVAENVKIGMPPINVSDSDTKRLSVSGLQKTGCNTWPDNPRRGAA